MTDQHPIIPPPPHLLKKFSTQAQDEAKKRNGAGYLKTFATLCIEWAMNSKTTSNDRQIRSSEITPPPELFAEWLAEAKRLHPNESLGFISGQIAQLAYRAGADMELEACCEWLIRDWTDIETADKLRAARRPKPPSLKEQALAELELLKGDAYNHGLGFDAPAIRRALDALPD